MSLPKFRTVEKGCENCGYLDVPPDKDGVSRVRGNHGYRCTAQIPDGALRVPSCCEITVKRNRVTKGEGRGCPTWTPRD